MNIRYLFREYRELTLFAKEEDDMEDWRASFLRAGIYTHRQVAQSDLEDEDHKPKFERELSHIISQLTISQWSKSFTEQ